MRHGDSPLRHRRIRRRYGLRGHKAERIEQTRTLFYALLSLWSLRPHWSLCLARLQPIKAHANGRLLEHWMVHEGRERCYRLVQLRGCGGRTPEPRSAESRAGKRLQRQREVRLKGGGSTSEAA